MMVVSSNQIERKEEVRGNVVTIPVKHVALFSNYFSLSLFLSSKKCTVF